MALPATYRPQPAPPRQAELKRKDTWWIEPVLTVVVLTVFLVYGVWRGFEFNYFDTQRSGLAMHYLSPFYSPPLQDWLPMKWTLSPAFVVLLFPASFRATCYFCRRSYYRAFFWDPPACAVPEILRQTRNYGGERRFPLLMQNLHRYALYGILFYVVMHWIHLVESCFFTERGHTHFGLGLGTLVLGLDAVLLSLYVFSCHSFRHIIGGVVNRFSTHQKRYALWSGVSALNIRHGLYFWLSLFSVGFADFYVRLVCSHAIPDLRLF